MTEKFFQFFKAERFYPSVLAWVTKLFPNNPIPASDLLQFGAIYVDQVRITSDQAVEAHQLLRVHFAPRRFAVDGVSWSDRLVFANDDFLVLDKPHGVPVHATLDNLIENVLFQLQRHLGQELFLTQRLDVPTGGLLVFGKTAAFQSRFNKSLRLRNVEKSYLALLEGAVTCGEHRHFMEKNIYQPKKLTAEPSERAQLCSLTVENCEVLFNGQSQVSVQLHTGRTHQIRAQMAAIGAPLVGDQMYGSRTHGHNILPLLAQRLAFFDCDTHYDFRLPAMRWQQLKAIFAKDSPVNSATLAAGVGDIDNLQSSRASRQEATLSI